ncbi:MAG: SEL1-like repeat protein [Gammaproteobacteria bacterium]|nr:SEL1-like repeat protein [Gammaproteobacteria bacterium]
MRLRCARYFILLPLLLLLAPAVPAAEGDDPYVKLFKVQQGMAEKGDPLAEFYLGEMYQEGLGTKVDLDQALFWYKRSAAKGNALAKKRLADTEREQTEAEKAKRRAAERAREAAEARAQQKAEADAKAKQKTETAKLKTDTKAKQKADAEAARLAKEEEEAKAQLAKKPEEDAAKREARRRAILDQVRRVQQERAKEGEAFW